MKNNRIEALLAMLESTPDDPFLHYALATEYLSTGEVEKARAGFEMLLRNHPEYVATYYHFAKILWAEGRTEEAIGLASRGAEVARKAGEKNALRELNILLEEMQD